MNIKIDMKKTVLRLGICILAILESPQPLFAQTNGISSHERVGIYDSRAVAVAFAGSPAYKKSVEPLLAESKRAKKQAEEIHDSQTVAKLDSEMKARRVNQHKQAFSTAPVDDILVHITNALPEIQRSAGVSVLVSKWNDIELKKHSGANMVDVTMKLVDAFQPDEGQRKSAVEIQKHQPIPLEQASKIKD